jgi:hypothetical protein
MGRAVDVFSAPVIGTWGWEIKPNRCFADPIASTYFGMTPDEGRQGQPIQRYLDAIHPEDQERVEWAIGKTVHEGAPFRETYRVNTLDGETRCILAAGFCYRDPDGSPDLYPGHIIDLGRTAQDYELIYEFGGLLTLLRQRAQGKDMEMIRYLLDMAHIEFWTHVDKDLALERRGKGTN